MSVEENKQTVLKMWNALTKMDWETLESCLSDDVHYEDVPTDDPGARGKRNVVKRLGIAFDHLKDHHHTIHHLVCEGDVVFLDHTEVWTFKTGEQATNQFATVHEMKNGKVARWSDYWDVAGFVGQFPQWFLQEMAKATQADFTSQE
jgi:ketosteroid isomerase-like protein